MAIADSTSLFLMASSSYWINSVILDYFSSSLDFISFATSINSLALSLTEVAAVVSSSPSFPSNSSLNSYKSLLFSFSPSSFLVPVWERKASDYSIVSTNLLASSERFSPDSKAASTDSTPDYNYSTWKPSFWETIFSEFMIVFKFSNDWVASSKFSSSKFSLI